MSWRGRFTELVCSSTPTESASTTGTSPTPRPSATRSASSKPQNASASPASSTSASQTRLRNRDCPTSGARRSWNRRCESRGCLTPSSGRPSSSGEKTSSSITSPGCCAASRSSGCSAPRRPRPQILQRARAQAGPAVELRTTPRAPDATGSPTGPRGRRTRSGSAPDWAPHERAPQPTICSSAQTCAAFAHPGESFRGR